MPIIIESRRKKPETLQKKYPQAFFIDVTSRGTMPWVRFSPFFPHGQIPIPLSLNYFAASVEGIWQGLKVFEKADIDLAKFTITDMKGLKRSTRVYGRVLGHRAGVTGNSLLAYGEARYKIYLPAYTWVLNTCLQSEIAEIKRRSENTLIILLDYETNCDIENLKSPLSHASLIAKYIQVQGS